MLYLARKRVSLWIFSIMFAGSRLNFFANAEAITSSLEDDDAKL